MAEGEALNYLHHDVVRQVCDYLTVFPPKDTIEVPMDNTWDLLNRDLKKALLFH